MFAKCTVYTGSRNGCEIIVPEKRGQVIQVTCTAHHTLVVVLCNGFLWINMGYYADQLGVLALPKDRLES
jgi:hypothetical protein